MKEHHSEIDVVHEWFLNHKDEMVKDIQKLISIKSVSAQKEGSYPYGRECAKALDVMLELGDSYGLQVENHDYHYGCIQIGNGEKSLGIWNHLDVVEEGKGWEFPPYEGILHHDFIIGRGAQDNKGPTVAVLYALRCINDLNLSINIQVRQIFGCNEEQGMKDVDVYLKENKMPDFSFVADCGFPVCNGEKGICELELITNRDFSDIIDSFTGGESLNSIPSTAIVVLKNSDRITASGLTGHAAFPDHMENAIGKLFAFISERKEVAVFKDTFTFLGSTGNESNGETLGISWEDKEFGTLTCVVTKVYMKGGHIHICLNIRYPHSWNYNQMMERLKAKIQDYGLSLEVQRNSPSYLEESPYISDLLQAYEKVTKEKGYTYTMGGGTYARKLPRTVAFGPGLPIDGNCLNLPNGHGACHGPDEAQSIANLITAGRIYVESILKLSDSLWSDQRS